jgi:hypothetical protein
MRSIPDVIMLAYSLISSDLLRRLITSVLISSACSKGFTKHYVH